MKRPKYDKGEHPYGESYLNWHAPPDGATGLVIHQWLTKKTKSRLFRGTQYFIFRHISGSHDYRASNGEWMCGGYQAAMGYWWFDSEEKRDEYYEWLMSTGLFNEYRSDTYNDFSSGSSQKCG